MSRGSLSSIKVHVKPPCLLSDQNGHFYFLRFQPPYFSYSRIFLSCPSVVKDFFHHQGQGSMIIHLGGLVDKPFNIFELTKSQKVLRSLGNLTFDHEQMFLGPMAGVILLGVSLLSLGGQEHK